MRPTNCRFGFFPKDFLSYLAQAGKLGVITGRGGGGCALLSTCQEEEEEVQMEEEQEEAKE